jgi:hypothetical protein
MSLRERTRQQLDPAGTLGARVATVVLASGAFLYGLVFTLLSLDQISSPVLAIESLVALGASSATVVIAARPSRAIFSRNAHYLVIALAVLAALLAALAGQGANDLSRDDWAPVAMGLLFVALGPYRPSIEIASIGVLAAIFVGFLILLQAPYFSERAPSVAFVVTGLAPMIAFCFGSAAFSGSIVRSIERWHERADQATDSMASRLHDGIARSVQQNRVTILNRDVLPFFGDMLRRGEVTDADRGRARAIADSIRSLMVAEVDRSWLENVIEQTIDTSEPTRGSAGVVQDSERLAFLMTTDQRTALRAIIVALFEAPNFDTEHLAISLRRYRSQKRGILRAAFDTGDHAMKASLAPYLAVMRVVFDSAQAEFTPTGLTIRFSYEQR